MIVHQPPTPWSPMAGAPTIFLAGSIDMGAATNWQHDLITVLGDRKISVLNPRRDDWDSSWKQSIDEPQFRTQVEWELDGLERADVIAMWFAKDSVAPITLLELGLCARAGTLIVGCPEGFWRKGNIEVVCARFGIPIAKDWAAFVAIVCAKLDQAGN
jgi:hypothetical protein